MSSISDISSLFRKRDLLALAAILLALYVTIDMHGYQYTIEPDWYIDQRKSRRNNVENIAPVITDLDGNGENEIIVVTRDHYLKVLSASSDANNKAGIYTPLEEASVRLSTLNVQKGNVPVAIETGYVDPYSESEGRKQVIVVVREDWTVSCFDMTLKLLWEKAVSHKSHEMSTMANYYKIDDVAIYVAPLSLEEDSTGVIVVGASMKPRDEESAAKAIKLEEGLVGESGATEHPEMKLRAALEHFSVFALDSKDGHVIWKHDGSSVSQDQYIHSLPQHMFKEFKASITDMTSFHQSRGINDWALFRQSLLNELPHIWRDKDDANMRIAHFVRKHIGAGSTTQVGQKPLASSSSAMNGNTKMGEKSEAIYNKLNPDKIKKDGKNAFGLFTGLEAPIVARDADLPHDSSEHIEHPNVLVAHTRRGVEVLALKTGTPITSLALNEKRVYGDIDGDGVVDQLLLLERPQDVSSHGDAFSNHHGQLQHCTLLVVSGLPPRSQLFNGSLCMNHRHLHDPVLSKAGASRSLLPAEISATTPVTLRTMDERSKKPSNTRDIVVAINSGVVTCFNSRGEQRWQINGAPTWNIGHKMHALLAIDADASRVDSLGTHDTIHSQLLLIGTRNMVLMDRDGDILETVELPNIPIAHPILGDFDSDGITDLILITDDAILGYKFNVKQSVRALFMFVLVLIVITAIVFFSNIRANVVKVAEGDSGPVTSSPRASSSSVSAQLHAKKKSVLSLIRSTDEHLD